MSLSPEREQEKQTRIERVLRGTLGTWEATIGALDDLRDLLAEVDRLRARVEELEGALHVARSHPLGCEKCFEGVRWMVNTGASYLDNRVLCDEARAALAGDQT